LRLDPDQAEAHNNLGVIESGSGRIAEAAADFRAALRLSPNFDEPRKNLEALEAAHPELK
jgi:Flp pilus assembly protein TadD